jgi:hypothetical protein
MGSFSNRCLQPPWQRMNINDAHIRQSCIQGRRHGGFPSNGTTATVATATITMATIAMTTATRVADTAAPADPYNSPPPTIIVIPDNTIKSMLSNN